MNLKIAGLTENEWQAASRDERLLALQELENQLSDQQQRHTCDIKTFSGNPLEYGNYDSPAHINLNESLLHADSLKDAVDTIAHEGRHAYQDHCICYPDDHPEVDATTIDAWRDNFANYVDPDIDYEQYLNQPIEVDAFGYESTISKALNIQTQSRTSMEALQQSDATPQSPSRRQAPPAREGGPTFVSPSREALDKMRLEYYGDPVKLSAEQIPKQPAQDATAARETIALPKNYVQALLDEKNVGSAKGRAADEYALLVKGESVPVMDGSVELNYHEPTEQYVVQCDKDQESALQKHLADLISHNRDNRPEPQKAPSRDFERE